MKKTYINPQIEVIKIQTQQMLAGSPDGAYEELGGGVQLSREYILDFEDEEF